ncbi:NAD(P)/FAD-dependent oxidoreductase [Kluyvera sp. CHPC 1.2972]|uniref:NAD(P)/FAD-dependent oxidoreductase n=1 Tax=Kluyvera sp. CHPC 1.2972 TaxID=2995176 RepID=UPI002FD828EB
MNVVIIGAGQAAATLGCKLRELGFSGGITLIGEEAYYPYQRPPLSKKFLKGSASMDDLLIRETGYYAQQKIAVQLNTSVQSIDAANKILLTAQGQQVAYDKLVLATGATPRHLPQEELMHCENVLTFRGLDDCQALAAYMQPQKTMCIIGGGYIGLELAAVARGQGMNVVVLERESRILQRVACEETAEYVTRYHRENQVTILTNENVAHYALEGQCVERLYLQSGRQVDVDVVVVGIGVLPNSVLAEEAGMELALSAVRVNHRCQTSAEHIYAIGDCSSFSFNGRMIRLESVQNALEQAEIVAQDIIGNMREYQPKPWFWSDQGSLKIQIAGLAYDYNCVISRVSKSDNNASFWYFNDDVLIAVDAINDAKAFMLGRKFVGQIIMNKQALADGSQALKSILL